MGNQSYAGCFDFIYGDLDNKTLWIRPPTNHLFSINQLTLKVILELNQGTNIEEVCKKYDLNIEEALELIQILKSEKAIVEAAGGKIIYESHKDIALSPLLLVFCSLLLIQLLYFRRIASTFAVKSWREGSLIMVIAVGAIFFHELGHFLAARRYFKPKFGFTFLFILPAIYVDTQQAWRLPRNIRLLINSAGLLSDFLVNIIAIILAIIFPYLEYYITPFLLTQYWRLSLILNPLFPTDGYWILSDLTKQVNLRKLALQNLKSLKFNLYSLYGLLSFLFMVVASLGLFWLLFNLLHTLLKRLMS